MFHKFIYIRILASQLRIDKLLHSFFKNMFLIVVNLSGHQTLSKVLVVLPFENLGSIEDGYFADGITDAITARLAVIRGLGVISRQSAMQYKKREKSAQVIGKELRVDYILEGTVQRERPSDPNS
ncbi:unnamed protein product, partial [marine sediment metagenome]